MSFSHERTTLAVSRALTLEPRARILGATHSTAMRAILMASPRFVDQSKWEGMCIEAAEAVAHEWGLAPIDRSSAMECESETSGTWRDFDHLLGRTLGKWQNANRAMPVNVRIRWKDPARAIVRAPQSWKNSALLHHVSDAQESQPVETTLLLAPPYDWHPADGLSIDGGTIELRHRILSTVIRARGLRVVSGRLEGAAVDDTVVALGHKAALEQSVSAAKNIVAFACKSNGLTGAAGTTRLVTPAEAEVALIEYLTGLSLSLSYAHEQPPYDNRLSPHERFRLAWILTAQRGSPTALLSFAGGKGMPHPTSFHLKTGGEN